MITYARHGVDGIFLGRSTPVVDDRGSFTRVFDPRALEAAGGPALVWVELNQSRSRRGAIRGLHLRRDLRQWKQIRVVRGTVFDVVVDLRPGNDSYRCVVTVELDEAVTQQLIIPPGCAHGFQALSDETDVSFSSSVASDPLLDGGIRFDDASLDVGWPLWPPVLGGRDATLPRFDAVASELAQAFADAERG